MSQNLFSGLIFLLIYGFAMFAMNFVKLQVSLLITWHFLVC
ncbi:hypothetical protein CU001_1324 [Enterococcus faecium]|nr:hypothetical protein [Enterococcus faecium]